MDDGLESPGTPRAFPRGTGSFGVDGAGEALGAGVGGMPGRGDDGAAVAGVLGKSGGNTGTRGVAGTRDWPGVAVPETLGVTGSLPWARHFPFSRV